MSFSVRIDPPISWTRRDPVVTIVLDLEGAEYIANVMNEEYWRSKSPDGRGGDQGAKNIWQEITDAVEAHRRHEELDDAEEPPC